jgi:beta-phosphoglucomutase-like phosphatase (HAD superfamily)
MAINALLFDMDGTLADTAPVWRVAEDALFAACGTPWDAAVQRQCLGMNARDLAAKVHELLRPAAPVAECQRVMRETLVATYRGGTVREMPGAVALVRRLAGRVPLAVASGSPLAGIETVVTQLGIRDLFALLLTSEEVARGKPHPDVFLEAARRLGVPPAECVVFEDSLVGTQAAVAAGMRVYVCPAVAPEAIAKLATGVVRHWDDLSAAQVFGA